jgi:hypothetical protein
VSRRRVVNERNEGRRQLLAALALRGLNQSQAARLLRHEDGRVYSRSEICLWLAGKRVPEYRGRVECAREFGVALDVWDREMSKVALANTPAAIPEEEINATTSAVA